MLCVGICVGTLLLFIHLQTMQIVSDRDVLTRDDVRLSGTFLYRLQDVFSVALGKKKLNSVRMDFLKK